jgi:hypothetical protein
MGFRHILWTTAELAANSAIRSHFVFTIPNTFTNLVESETRNRTLSMVVSGKLADYLRDKSFEVSEVWHGSAPWSAGFDVRLTNFEVIFLLSARGLKRKIIHGHGSTWCLRPRWKHPSGTDVSNGWEHVCAVIEEIFREDLKATSVRRLANEPDVEQEDADMHLE